MDDGIIDLIYLDPPFNSNRNYSAPIGSEAAGAAFKDTWSNKDVNKEWLWDIAIDNEALYDVIRSARSASGKPMASYLIYMSVRLIEMHRVLKDTGSLYLHCDTTASHYLKLVLDAIFGHGNFRNEIAWCYKKMSSPTRKFASNRDSILFYAKSRKAIFNRQKIKLAKPVRRLKREVKDGVMVNSRDADGKIMYIFKDDKDVDSNWIDIPLIVPANKKERTGYPTQKPLALLKRIIEASSNKGGLILDPFCGCATACVAAEDLGRKWIGIDISLLAERLINARFKKELGIIRPEINHRTDIPHKTTEVEQSTRSRSIKKFLFSWQEGFCNGCGDPFHPRNFTVDHRVPIAKGGLDIDTNLQLLCGYCNSTKNKNDMAYLWRRLSEEGYPVNRNPRFYSGQPSQQLLLHQ